jgi:hypothetical protein
VTAPRTRHASHRARAPRLRLVAALTVIALFVVLAVLLAVVFVSALIGVTPS